jgi:hypothetical protein
MVKMVALVLNLKTSLTIQLCQQRVGGEEIWSTVLIPLTTNVSLKVATPWAWTLMGIPEAVAGPGVLKKVNGPGVAVPITSIMFNNIQSSIVCPLEKCYARCTPPQILLLPPQKTPDITIQLFNRTLILSAKSHLCRVEVSPEGWKNLIQAAVDACLNLNFS